jgi:hypothetical protein
MKADNLVPSISLDSVNLGFDTAGMMTKQKPIFVIVYIKLNTLFRLFSFKIRF